MKIAEINMVTKGSTGRIMFQVAETARAAGHKAKTFSPVPFVRGKKNRPEDIPDHFWWGSRWEAMFHYYVGTLLGMNGLFSWCGTRNLIKQLKAFSPDVIHLHNIHGFCLNLPMFFRYLKTSGAKVVWTFHDCWAFTGNCSHFVVSGCNKWQTLCERCPQSKVYPKMYLDTSRWMFHKKKEWFSGLSDLVIVTPSEWLAKLVKQSFLKDHTIEVINNGIDLSVFKPKKSDFRERYNIKDKKILLGVSFYWGYEKGLDVFIELAKRLDPDRYQIVLVGTDDSVDKELPDGIISIHRTNNQNELAEFYSAADLFVSPTRAENYPTVNMESIACGTPVLTFDAGGSAENLDSLTGSVIKCGDIDAMEEEIIRISSGTVFFEEACLQKSESFDRAKRFNKYIELFHSMCKGEKQ